MLSLWCNKLVLVLGLKRNKSKHGSENVNIVESKTGSKTSVLAFLKSMDGSVLVSLKCMDASVLAHLRFPIQSATTRFPKSGNPGVP